MAIRLVRRKRQSPLVVRQHQRVHAGEEPRPDPKAAPRRQHGKMCVEKSRSLRKVWAVRMEQERPCHTDNRSTGPGGELQMLAVRIALAIVLLELLVRADGSSGHAS